MTTNAAATGWRQSPSDRHRGCRDAPARRAARQRGRSRRQQGRASVKARCPAGCPCRAWANCPYVRAGTTARDPLAVSGHPVVVPCHPVAVRRHWVGGRRHPVVAPHPGTANCRHGRAPTRPGRCPEGNRGPAYRPYRDGRPSPGTAPGRSPVPNPARKRWNDPHPAGPRFRRTATHQAGTTRSPRTPRSPETTRSQGTARSAQMAGSQGRRQSPGTRWPTTPAAWTSARSRRRSPAECRCRSAIRRPATRGIPRRTESAGSEPGSPHAKAPTGRHRPRNDRHRKRGCCGRRTKHPCRHRQPSSWKFRRRRRDRCRPYRRCAKRPHWTSRQPPKPPRRASHSTSTSHLRTTSHPTSTSHPTQPQPQPLSPPQTPRTRTRTRTFPPTTNPHPNRPRQSCCLNRCRIRRWSPHHHRTPYGNHQRNRARNPQRSHGLNPHRNCVRPPIPSRCGRDVRPWRPHRHAAPPRTSDRSSSAH